MRLIKKRILFTSSVFILLWLLLLYRGLSLQVFPQKRLSLLKKELFETTLNVKSRRGIIYDRNGKELAVSVSSLSLFADPKQMDEPYYAAKLLSSLFSIPKKNLLKNLLDKKKRFVWIKRHLKKQEISTIQAWKIKGLHFISEPKRFYPKNVSLSQVLGFTGIDGQGLEGVEKQYDKWLKGTEKRYILKRDARGRPLFADFTPFIHWTSGYNIYLTVDSDLQFYLEKELKKALSKSKAKSALGLVLDAKTSEILAMVSLPSYNLNNPFRFNQKLWRNRTLTDSYEPGSTLKPFTVAAALKKGISPKKTYQTKEGFLKVGGEVIKEAERDKKFKSLMDMSEILSFSSNVGAARLSLEVGDEDLRKTLLGFGFNKKTGVDFPGESAGLLHPLKWRPIETVTAGFGHGVSATALQIANAYTAIANGGTLKKPILVKEIRNPYNGESRSLKSEVIRSVLTKEQAHILTLMLTSAVEEKGTGFRARVPGYLSAGKTGTAQMVDFKKGGYKKEYISSFAGFVPAHNPKFVIYVAIEGAKKNFYGSILAAPIFSKVASYSVRKAGLSPVVLDEKDFFIKQNFSASKAKRKPAFNGNQVPDFKGLALRHVVKEAGKIGLSLKIKGSNRVIKTDPPGGAPLPENKTLTVILD